MKFIVLDVETTGLINKKEKDLTKQPYIVQFAGIIFEYDIYSNKLEIIKTINELIKPPISIPYITSQIHNIFDIDVIEKQTTLELLPSIIQDINSCEYVVGHNIEFDLFVLNIEVKRLQEQYGLLMDYNPRNIIDTMNETINYCAIPRKDGSGYKRPKLSELHRKIFGKYIYGAHNALIDVEHTMNCFIYLLQNKVIQIKQNDKLTIF